MLQRLGELDCDLSGNCHSNSSGIAGNIRHIRRISVLGDIMAAGQWERFATEIVVPGLQSAAAELNQRDDILAECAEDPFGDGCLLWIAHRRPPMPLLWPAGSLTVQDQPQQGQVRIEEIESNAPTRRAVSISLPSSEVSASWIKARAIAFAERVTTLGSGGCG